MLQCETSLVAVLVLLLACSHEPPRPSFLNANERQDLTAIAEFEMARAEAHGESALDDSLTDGAQRDHATLSRLYEAQAETRYRIAALTADLERRNEEAAAWRAAYESKDAQRRALADSVNFAYAERVALREAGREFDMAEADETRRHRARQAAYAQGLVAATSALEARLSLVESAVEIFERLGDTEAETANSENDSATEIEQAERESNESPSERLVRLTSELDTALVEVAALRAQLSDDDREAARQACATLADSLADAEVPHGQHDEGLMIYAKDAEGSASSAAAIRRELLAAGMPSAQRPIVLRGRTFARRLGLAREAVVLRGQPEAALVLICGPGPRRGTANLN